jgi:hypothetical protein
MALSLAVVALASCGPERNQFPPACPVPALIRPLSELTRTRTGSPDIRDLVIRARIVDIVGNCESGDNNSVVAKVQIVVDALRGPQMQASGISLPVFVAITEGDMVFDKVLFWLTVEFRQNVDTVRATSNEVRMVIPVTAQKSAAAYGVIGGFQLLPEEIAAWRRANPRQRP